MAVASPADLAARLSATKSLGTSEAIAAVLLSNCPSVTQTAKTLGLDMAVEVSLWIDSAGVESVKCWVQPDTEPIRLLKEWEHLKQNTPGVLSSLLAEQRLGERGSDIGPYLHSSRTSYAEALIDARWLTARALKRRAGSVPFFEQVLLARTCNLTRHYYHSLRPFADEVSFDRNIARIEWEISRLTITAARFDAATVDELNDALAYLKSRPDGHLDIQAAAFRLEALVELYHATGDREHLQEAVGFSKTVVVPEDDWPLWHVSLAEAYMNLVEHASPHGRTSFVEIAYNKLNTVLTHPVDNVTLHIRAKLLRALAKYCLDHPATPARLRNVRLPFLLRTAGSLPEIVRASAPYLIRSIQGVADRGQYQHREFLARARSNLALMCRVTSGQQNDPPPECDRGPVRPD